MTHDKIFAVTLSLVLVMASTAGAQSVPPSGIVDDKIGPAVERHVAKTLTFRHQIHQNPELGNREYETAKLVEEHLLALGIEVRNSIAHTGVMGVLKGGKDGPTIAVRADMDALPVTEDTDLPFKSTKRGTYNGQDVGIMHACGHDIHTAVQMGVASVLVDLKADIPGTVLFIFQPAEEGPPPGEEGGAELMIREGVFDDPHPEAVFGLHALAHLPVGQIGFTEGPALAAVDHFRATVKGVQTHGAQPHQGVDAIVMASQAVVALQTIVSRNLDPLQPVVVTVGMFHSGERFNIIPAEVRLEGTVRTYDAGVRDTVERRMGEILDGITKAGGGSFVLDYDRGTPATINDPEAHAMDGTVRESHHGRRGCGRAQSDDGRRGFLVLRERGPRLFLSPGNPQGRDRVGPAPFADVPCG